MTKNKADLQDVFAELIFQFPYKRAFDNMKAFCELHAGEYIKYRKTIARRGREIRQVKSLSQNEYNNYIWRWYNDRVQIEDVLEGMTTGERWATKETMPINSIGLFHSFVVARWKVYRERLDRYFPFYNDGEGYTRKDRWFFDLFSELDVKYNDRYRFDPWWGFRERSKVYTGVMPGTNYVVLTTDWSREDLKELAEKIGAKAEYKRGPLPHYRLNKSEREAAIRYGARKADRAKMAEIAGHYSGCGIDEHGEVEPEMKLGKISRAELTQIKRFIETVLDKPTFDKWISPLSCIGKAESVIYFGSTHGKKISWIKQNLLEKINNKMGKEFGLEIKLIKQDIPEDK